MTRGGVGAATGAILALVLASSAWGYGYLDLGIGPGVFQGSARSAGMGEVGIVGERGPLGVALNPAFAAVSRDPQIALTYRGVSIKEDWAFPAYDSFDALLGYNTYSANSNAYHDFGYGVVSGEIGVAEGVSVGLALSTAYDFRYDYAEQAIDRTSTAQPPDRTIARDWIEASGEIKSLSVGIARPVNDKVRLGVGCDYLFGEHEVESAVSFTDPTKVPWASGTAETSSTFRAGGLEGVRFSAGALIDLYQRFSVGATYRTRAQLGGDLTAGVPGPDSIIVSPSDVVRLPASFAVGVSFKPRNELATVIEGNLIYTRWSDATDPTGLGAAPNDTYEWHLGVEHVFYNQRPLRFGFLYRPSPTDKETAEPAVTAGTGFAVEGFDIDLAAKVGWRQYRWADLFSDELVGAKRRQGTDRVTETTMGATVSITRRF
jgi:hypothetical protein